MNRFHFPAACSVCCTNARPWVELSGSATERLCRQEVAIRPGESWPSRTDVRCLIRSSGEKVTDYIHSTTAQLTCTHKPTSTQSQMLYIEDSVHVFDNLTHLLLCRFSLVMQNAINK